MVGDRIWMARFEGAAAASTGLDAILHDDFDELRAARIAEDARIEAFVAELDEVRLDDTLAYISHEGHAFEDPMAVLLPHFFNHQTHHRGQITAMLRQTGCTYPELDMHRLMIPAPGGTRVRRHKAAGHPGLECGASLHRPITVLQEIP